MKMIKYIIIPAILIGLLSSCSEEVNDSSLQDDFLLKTLGPAIAGETMEFAYAMGTLEGTLVSATATANFEGGEGTGFDPHSYHTDSRGNDVGVLVATVNTEGSTSTADFDVDTVASTLRYTYVVPEEAKGQPFSITFEAESSTGETVTTKTPEYRVSEMDMVKEIVMTNDDVCYFSLETMQAYTEAEVVSEGMTENIDLIYIYDPVTPEGYIYGHSLVSPGSEEQYLNGRTVPSSFTKNRTKIEKLVFLRDMHFTGEVPAQFVDDIDLENLDLSQATDFVLGINSMNSVFVESEDGRYRAYIYFNEARSRTLTFGIKRMEMQ